MKSKNAERMDYSYVFSAKKKLELESNKKETVLFGKMKSKWAVAAAIALASGSAVLFAPVNKAQAAEADSNVQTEQVDTAKKSVDNNASDNTTAVVTKNGADKQDVDDKAATAVGTDKKNIQSRDVEKVVSPGNTIIENFDVSKTNSEDTSAGDAITHTTDLVKQDKNAQGTVEVQQNQKSVRVDDNNPDTVNSDSANWKYNTQHDIATNDPDHTKGNVQDAWAQGYKGEGIAIAVIDSGADVNHKDFKADPTDPKFSKEEMDEIISKLGHGRYVSPKIPYVHNVVNGDDDDIKEIPSKKGEIPHGQHVAGIVAADGHSDTKHSEYVVGVAPESQLMILRFLGTDNTQPEMADAIYDAVNAGADVISISIAFPPDKQNLNDATQRAVQYAIDHGVVVSVAASNNGNGASVDNTSNINNPGNTDDPKDPNRYWSGTDAGNYEPFNSGAISSPGVSKNVITVASEASYTGDESNMSSFSTWGPLPDFTLKPDISAPGDGIRSTTNDNGYGYADGTSMATPFTSGVAALVLERLKKTNPNLKGADLVQAVKGLIMSTAQPMTHDTEDGEIIVSPRRQGTGQINAGAATKSPVYITADDGTSSLSLRSISNSTSFTLTFHNLSDQAQTYTFDDFGGGYTEQRDPDSGIFSDVRLSDTHVNGQETITIAPKSTTKFTYTLNLDGVDKNQLVEGYLHFTSESDQPDLAIPYLGYYGDMTSEDVFDKDAGQGDPDIAGNHFDNENKNPLGIADDYSLSQITGQEKNNEDKWAKLAQKYDSGKVAFSPGDNGNGDILVPFTYLKQNIKDLTVEILNDKGEVVYVIADDHDVARSYHSDGDGKTMTSTNQYQWNGMIYNDKSGKMEVAPDGKYTYRYIATLYNKGPHQVQIHDTPIIIDTAAPVLDDFKYDSQTHTVSGIYHDPGVGFTDYSYGILQINDQNFTFKLNGGNNTFDNRDKTKGHFTMQLNDDELKALANVKNEITVTLSDVADNELSKTIKVAGMPESHQRVTVWNAINHHDFDTNDDIYTLTGSADHDFYINGKLVQVNNGEYAVDVDTGTDIFIFSSDKDGKDRLYTFVAKDPDTGNNNDEGDNQEDPIKFEYFKNNDYKVFTKEELDEFTKEGFYNPTTGEFTVTGTLSDPANVSQLIAVTHGNSENDSANIVNFDKKSGKFSFKFKAPTVGQKFVEYICVNNKGEKYRGVIGAQVDIEEPTINMEVPTIVNKPVLHLSGIVNDNMDGYRVYINDNAVFTQQSSGDNYNYHPESALPLNVYGPYNINYDINLDDQNGKPTDHIIMVQVIDKVGNNVVKRFKVHYDPNYNGQSETTPGEDVSPITEKPANNTTLGYLVNNDSSDNNSASVNNQDDAITLTLTHNAFVYDGNGKIVVTPDGKNTLLEKGNTISALHNGKVTTLAGKDYVQVGNNAYVKLANTLLKKLVVHNAYLYDANGNAIGQVGKLNVVKHGKFVYVWNNGQKFNIKGKQFYRLVNGRFIKVANLQSVRAIKITHYRARLYNENGKLLKKRITLTKGNYYWAWNNAKIVKINGKSYYRVGKNRYVRAKKAVVAKANTALDADKLK